MIRFLKENWLWIVAPMFLVLGGLLLLLSLTGEQGGADEPFVYNIFGD